LGLGAIIWATAAASHHPDCRAGIVAPYAPSCFTIRRPVRQGVLCCQQVVSLTFDAYRFATTERADFTRGLNDGGSRTLPLDFIHNDADKVLSSLIVELVENKSVAAPQKGHQNQ
jgi:hypothetical protein